MFTLLGSFIASFFMLTNAYTAGRCSGQCLALDPAVIQRASDEKYFRFSTGPGIPITTASNLTGPWKNEGSVLPGGSSIKLPNADSKMPWAPDVHNIDGTYYLYYSISTLNTPISAIGVATSKTMDPGSWQDHGEIGVKSSPDSGHNAIDPNLLVLENGTFLNFGSYFNGLQQVGMKDPLHRDPESKPRQIAYNATGGDKQEAAFVFKKGPHYFLLFSVGVNLYPDNAPIAPGTEYRVAYCRSENPHGDFVDQHGTPCTKNGGDTLIESDGRVYGPGGQGVLNDLDQGLILYYHYADKNIGLKRSQFQFGWNKLCFTRNNWPFVC